MKTLVINCSPVRNGATAEIARLIFERFSVSGEARNVCIDDYKIGFCRGCRKCHETAKCVLEDDVTKLADELAWADRIVCVSPSYWADVPGQFKAFIDRMTPWCDTHEPHASIPAGKKGCVVALRTGPGAKELEKIVETIYHFYGHLSVEKSGSLCLCRVENRDDVAARREEIEEFCRNIVSGSE